MSKLLFSMGLLLAAPAALAAVNRVPEPGTFELLTLSGVVALVIAIRKRHKK